MSDGYIPGSAPLAFSLAAGLIRHASRRAPPALAERLAEEWLAHLAAQPSGFAGLNFALGCCLATHVIAREHRAASAPVATSSSGSTTLALGHLRSPSMTRFRWLWFMVAAFAVTALLIFAAGELVEFLLPFVLSHSAYFAGSQWWTLAVSFGSWIIIGLHQMRVHRRKDGGPGLPESRRRVVLWFAAPVALATIALLFIASAWLGFAAMHVADSEIRMVGWGTALFFAVAGVALLLFTVFYCVHRRLDAGPGLAGSGRR